MKIAPIVRALQAHGGLAFKINLRENTERPVTVEEGSSVLAGTDMIRKEIAVYLLAYNLVRWTVATAAKALRRASAAEHRVDCVWRFRAGEHPQHEGTGGSLLAGGDAGIGHMKTI